MSIDTGIVFTAKGEVIISVFLLSDAEAAAESTDDGVEARNGIIAEISRLAVAAIDPEAVDN